MMQRLIFLIVAFILKQGTGRIYECDTTASCGCSISSAVLARIIGGETAASGSWSWAVSLRRNGEHICGGSILSPTFIVTAAHCIHNVANLSSLSILAGSIDLVPSESNDVYQIGSIDQIYEHYNYDHDQYTNDIALLYLSSPLNMTSGNLKPICLPTGTTVQPPDNISLVAVGWGVTSASYDTAAPSLRQVTVESIANADSNCQSIIDDSQLQFCAGLEAGGKGNTSIENFSNNIYSFYRYLSG
jgi:secreted trypsin-like serine protease